MGSQELSLTWEDHDRALMSVFERLLESNTFVDCTIAAEGQYLKAHKIVLSACSPYFELLFSQENEKNPIVIFKDIKFQELKAIIDFVYRGRVKIPEDRLGEFVEAAESLQINGLRGENERDDFQREENESSSLQKRGNRFISTRKDSRRGSISPGERNSGGISPEIVMNNESNSFESILQIETSVDVPESPHSQHASVSVNTNSNATAHGSNEEVNKVESKSSSSCIPPVSVSMEKILVDAESIVKTEPEPMTEVFVPESECSIEKVEESDEEMTVADNDGSDSTMKRGVQNQDNQYSAFPIFMESSGVGSSDSFMTSHVADRISAPAMDKRRRKLSLKEKFDVVKMITEERKTVKDAVIQFKCGKTQIYSIMKEKNDIIEKYMRCMLIKSRKGTNENYAEINRCVHEWFVQASARNVPISGPMLQEKGKELAKRFKIHGFSASDWWLQCFKKKYGITSSVDGGISNG